MSYVRYRIGEQASCKYCGQDIQNEGKRRWIDRGANRKCVPYLRRGDFARIYPKTKHAPNRLA